MKKIIVTGSLVYDITMTYAKDFEVDLKATNYNPVFIISDEKKDFWGTAWNIAYGLVSLWADFDLLGALGWDHHEYFYHLDSLRISKDNIYVSEKLITASAKIISDVKQKQITAFYPGAMWEASKQSVTDYADWILIVSPNDKIAMIKFVSESEQLFTIFDPGQALWLFSQDELIDIVKKSDLVINNEYEYNVLKETLAWRIDIDNWIVTKWADWLMYKERWSDWLTITWTKSEKPVDPTWCWDALRSGLLYWMQKGYDLKKSIEIGMYMWMRNVEEMWAQKYSINESEVKRIES